MAGGVSRAVRTMYVSVGSASREGIASTVSIALTCVVDICNTFLIY